MKTRTEQQRVPPWPRFDQDEIETATNVLQSGRVNQWTGSEVKSFGSEFAAFHDRHFGIANANGTVAIELALRALGAAGSVIVPSATFLATASAVVAVGARPLVADVDPDTHGLSAATVARAAQEDTSAVIPVHFGGMPVALGPLADLCAKQDWGLVEDCAQAHGAEVDGRKVGSWGQIGAYSFCQDKIMSTGGEGGMVVTDDEELWKSMWSYKDHGKDYDTVFHKQHPPGFRWLHESWGTNWRMTEMQAAIGRIQLQKLPQWLSLRRRNAQILNEHLQGLPGVRIPEVPSNVKPAYYKHYVYIENGTRDKVMAELNKQGVPAIVGSCSEIYLEEAFKSAGWGLEKRLPNAKRLGETSLCFQVHPTLEDEHMQWMGETAAKVIRGAG